MVLRCVCACMGMRMCMHNGYSDTPPLEALYQKVKCGKFINFDGTLFPVVDRKYCKLLGVWFNRILF